MIQALAQPDPLILTQKARDVLRRQIESGKLHRPRKYQANRLASQSRFNLDNWSRQTGKSDTAALDANLLAAQTGFGVMCLSASLDQTKEWMLKAAIYAEAVHGVAGDIQRAVMAGELDETFEVANVHGVNVRITQTIIGLPGGERIIGRPANPRTARGYSVHVKLDEFGMHQDADEIYAAAFGSITSDPRLRFDVMSTPPISSQHKMVDLIRAAEAKETDFEYRKVTVFDAIRDGLNVDPEQLRRNMRDEDRWRREYLCEIVEEAGALIPVTLIRACEHEGLTRRLPATSDQWIEDSLGWNPGEGELFLGIDVGRRHDLTVISLGQVLGDVAWTRAVLELRNVPFSEQRSLIDALMEKLPIRRTCIDATGLGMQLAEEAQQRFGDYRVEAVTFTPTIKAALAEPMRSRFEDTLIRIPVDIDLRNDINSIRKTTTAAGNIRYLAERTPDGHADRFWSLALMCHAAKADNETPRISFL